MIPGPEPSAKGWRRVRSWGSFPIVANAGWLTVDRVLRLTGGLLIGAWVARYLGPEQFGLFSFAAAFVALFSVLTSLGLDSLVIRDAVRQPELRDEIVATAFALKLGGGALAFCLAVLAMGFANPQPSAMWLVAIMATGAILQSFDAIDLWFQSRVQSKYTVWSKTGAFLIAAGLRICFIALHAPLAAFAVANAVEIGLGAAALAIFYSRMGAPRKAVWVSMSRARDWLRVGWPLILASSAIIVYMKIDQVLLGLLVGETEVGVYAAAVRLSEAWYFVPTILTSSIYPMLVRLHRQSEDLFYERLTSIMGYFFWASLAVSVLVAIFSHPIIALLYGSQYERAADVLAIHIFSLIITSMSIVFSQKFVLDESTKVSLFGTLFGAAGNVSLNLLLIPLLGAPGAALSTVVSYILPMALQTALFDRRIGKSFVVAVVGPLRDVVRLVA